MNKFTILFLTMFLALPMAMKADSAKEKKDDTRYLVGAVPEVEGKVVFSKEFQIPGMSQAQIYDTMTKWMDERLKENKNIDSRIVFSDEAKGTIAGIGYLSETLPKNVKTLYASELRIRKELPDVDLVVGSVLIPGDKAPHLITKEMLSMMQPGTVLVDVAIDQGGCFETSHPTTHSAPTYIVDGIVHYAVANIPGAVPYTSTLALTNATLPYVIALANKGWKKACKDNPALALGLNIVEGKIVYKAVADVFGLKYEPVSL